MSRSSAYSRRAPLSKRFRRRCAVEGRSRGAPSGDATPQTDAGHAANSTARIPTRGRSHPASGNPVHCSRAPACAGASIHDHLLAPGLGEFTPDQPSDDVGTRGGRAQRDDAYRFGWILLRAGVCHSDRAQAGKTQSRRKRKGRPWWNFGSPHKLPPLNSVSDRATSSHGVCEAWWIPLRFIHPTRDFSRAIDPVNVGCACAPSDNRCASAPYTEIHYCNPRRPVFLARYSPPSPAVT